MMLLLLVDPLLMSPPRAFKTRSTHEANGIMMKVVEGSEIPVPASKEHIPSQHGRVVTTPGTSQTRWKKPNNWEYAKIDEEKAHDDTEDGDLDPVN